MTMVEHPVETELPELASAPRYALFDPKAGSEVGIGFLQNRVLEWSYGLLGSRSETDTQLPGATAEARLLSIFTIFDEWFQREDYEAAVIIDTMLDMANGVAGKERRADYLRDVRDHLISYATEVHLIDPSGFALSWHVLMTGAIFSAVDGDQDAALRAKQMARGLIASFSPKILRASDDSFTPDELDAEDTVVSLSLDEIGTNLSDYESAATWIDQGTPLAA